MQRPRGRPEDGVPKEERYYVSKPRIGFPRAAANQVRPRAACQGRVEGGLRRKETTNICILGFDTSGGYDPGLLLILVEDVRVGVDVAVDDLEPGLVGDAVSVSECGRTGIWVARHDMEWGADEGGDGAAGVGRWGLRRPQIKNVFRGFGGVGAAQDDCNSEFPHLDSRPLSYVPPAVERTIALYPFIFFH